MSRADFVLFRRMRGISFGLLFVGVLLVPTLLVLGVTVPMQLDLYSDQFRQDAGRPGDVFELGFGIAAIVATIGAVVLGATAGSVDYQRGVLRDLVLAGRARWRIVLGRLVAATSLLLLTLGAAFAVTALVGATLAPIETAIEWDRVVREAGQYLPSIVYTLPFAAGVAMLVGSRGPAIAVYFVVALIVDGVLSAIPKAGEWWQHVSPGYAEQQVHSWISDPPALSMERSTWISALVLVAWAVVPFVAGIVRLSRRDL